MTFVLGLTGSIGMGKSTTAQMFADAGCDVWDADAAVHRLYAVGGAAVGPIENELPRAIVAGAVSRDILREIIAATPEALGDIEKIVHPLVVADRVAFLQATGADIAVLDIPLLYETGGHAQMDAVVVVSAPPEVQRARVLERGTMSEAQLDQILTKQLPDSEKRARGDYVIITDTVEHAAEQVQDVVNDIKRKLSHA